MTHHETQAQQIRVQQNCSRPTRLSAEPLIGLLELETDTGTIELAMNRILAEQLLFAIVEFLQAGKGDDAPHLRSSVRIRVAEQSTSQRLHKRSPGRAGLFSAGVDSGQPKRSFIGYAAHAMRPSSRGGSFGRLKAAGKVRNFRVLASGSQLKPHPLPPPIRCVPAASDLNCNP
ncbi:hypothetical protein [Mesorhizobium sp.]|uniref:hypothetical protein n=1 Tax=Mesorhizobium sp. TaxID=1871066 RepID=UPI00257B39A1|nr:hypothetical protein [Mesorhizobium sp.]